MTRGCWGDLVKRVRRSSGPRRAWRGRRSVAGGERAGGVLSSPREYLVFGIVTSKRSGRRRQLRNFFLRALSLARIRVFCRIRCRTRRIRFRAHRTNASAECVSPRRPPAFRIASPRAARVVLRGVAFGARSGLARRDGVARSLDRGRLGPEADARRRSRTRARRVERRLGMDRGRGARAAPARAVRPARVRARVPPVRAHARARARDAVPGPRRARTRARDAPFDPRRRRRVRRRRRRARRRRGGGAPRPQTVRPRRPRIGRRRRRGRLPRGTAVARLRARVPRLRPRRARAPPPGRRARSLPLLPVTLLRDAKCLRVLVAQVRLRVAVGGGDGRRRVPDVRPVSPLPRARTLRPTFDRPGPGAAQDVRAVRARPPPRRRRSGDDARATPRRRRRLGAAPPHPPPDPRRFERFERFERDASTERRPNFGRPSDASAARGGGGDARGRGGGGRGRRRRRTRVVSAFVPPKKSETRRDVGFGNVFGFSSGGRIRLRRGGVARREWVRASVRSVRGEGSPRRRAPPRARVAGRARGARERRRRDLRRRRRG